MKSETINLNLKQVEIKNEIPNKQYLVALSKDDLIARALESELAIEEGRLTSLEDLEKEMTDW